MEHPFPSPCHIRSHTFLIVRVVYFTRGGGGGFIGGGNGVLFYFVIFKIAV